MKIIRDDPNNFIPNICEKDAKEKVVMINLVDLDSPTEYIGLMVAQNSSYGFKGATIPGIQKGRISSECWSPLGKTLCELLIKSYQIYSRLSFRVSFYIFNNYHEVCEYFKEKGIP